jgi:hypothetical protein
MYFMKILSRDRDLAYGPNEGNLCSYGRPSTDAVLEHMFWYQPCPSTTEVDEEITQRGILSKATEIGGPLCVT